MVMFLSRILYPEIVEGRFILILNAANSGVMVFDIGSGYFAANL